MAFEIIDSFGNEIEVFDSGEGHPILLISGLGGQWKFWSPVIEKLKKTNRVISFNHPGIIDGTTYNHQTIESLTQAVVDILNHLGVLEVSVVGHSTGGLIAHSLALDHPNRIDRLVLSGTWARADQRFRDLCRLRISLLQKAGIDAHRVFSQLLGYPAEAYQTPEKINNEESKNKKIISVTTQRLEMLIAHDRSSSLKEIQHKTLIIGARDDQIVSLSSSLELHRLIPNSECSVFNDGGHFFPQIKSHEFTDRVIKHFI